MMNFFFVLLGLFKLLSSFFYLGPITKSRTSRDGDSILRRNIILACAAADSWKKLQ